MTTAGVAADAKHVQKLPMEDIAWQITLQDCESENDADEPDVGDEESQPGTSTTSVSQLAVITDSRRSFIGAGTVLPTVEHLGDSLSQLILECALQPLSGKPRRPRYVRTETEEAVESESCEAVFYCSEECQKIDLGLTSSNSSMTSDCHDHQKWCTRMKEYCAKEKTVADLPFTFMIETSDADFDHWQLHDFLTKRGLLGQGYWHLECAVRCQRQHPTHHGDLLLKLDSKANAYAVEGSCILSSAPSSSVDPVHSPFQCWADYYQWRGFGMDCPVAALLHWCLTLYHVLVNCWPRHYPDAASVMSHAQCVLVHLVGVGREVDLAPTFFELNHLLPGVEITIVMVGPELTRRSHGKVIQQDNVKVMVHRGLYDKYNGQAPDIVIGFNAGLGAYTSWMKTLASLKTSRIPSYFTDYCQYSCECARAPIEAPVALPSQQEFMSFAEASNMQADGAEPPPEDGVTRLATMSDITVNPFRSPFRKRCEEHRMPWYPNAFLYWLCYC